jgi:hypothetical protein
MAKYCSPRHCPARVGNGASLARLRIPSAVRGLSVPKDWRLTLHAFLRIRKAMRPLMKLTAVRLHHINVDQRAASANPLAPALIAASTTLPLSTMADALLIIAAFLRWLYISASLR